MGVINTILNGISNLWNYVKSLLASLNSVITWADGWFDDIWNTITGLYTYIYDGLVNDLNYAFSLYIALVNWSDNTVAGIYVWATKELNSISSAVNGWVNTLIRYIDDVETWAAQQLAAMLLYIYNTYIAPIWNAVQGAINWIGTYGAFILNLLTHPELLAELLGKYLLSVWSTLATQYALPFFKWFVASAMSYVPDITSILEDIISNLFD